MIFGLYQRNSEQKRPNGAIRAEKAKRAIRAEKAKQDQKQAREFKEAWHSLNKQTFNRHIDIPTIYLTTETLAQIS